MAKSGSTQTGAASRATATAWMSLKEASELTGRSRAELRTQIAAGELNARTIRRGDKVEHRLTRAALAEAGLIGAPPPAPAVEPAPAPSPSPESTPDTMAQLIGLIREQNQRISMLEDQRAQLAARLGATVEAMHQLEDRLEVILDARSVPPTSTSQASSLPVTTDDGLVIPPAKDQATGPASGETAGHRPTQANQLNGVRRSLTRLVREVAQPRLRELTSGPRREPSPGD